MKDSIRGALFGPLCFALGVIAGSWGTLLVQRLRQAAPTGSLPPALEAENNFWTDPTPIDLLVTTSSKKLLPEKLADQIAAIPGVQRVQATLYELASAYPKKMRPMMASRGRGEEWSALVSDIRLKYGNRPRFMEVLNGRERRRIVDSHSPHHRR